MQLLLLPFSWLYGFVMWVRNKLFDYGMLSQRTFDATVISVGNLSVGGTGKTPHVEKLLRMLQGRRVAVVSRGYGRRTRGFRYVEEGSSAEDVGDEPLQMKRKFPDVTFAVDEKRAHAIDLLLRQPEKPEIIILDDAFQHRYVKPWMQILLTDYSRLFTRDFVLPAGRLREFRKGYRRADLIIVTKCPENLSPEEAEAIKNEINPQGRQKVLFSSVCYAIPASAFRGKKVLLLTGIARPEPLLEYLRQETADVSHLRFPDHHRYTDSDIRTIIQSAAKADILLTTEKDAARLGDTDIFKNTEIKAKLQVMPISIKILFRKNKKHENS